MKHLFRKFALFSAYIILVAGTVNGQRPMENLGRGVVAVRSGSGIFVSWRLLGLDPSGIGFNLYRSANGGSYAKLNSSVLTGGTNYSDNTANVTVKNAYYVKPVISGVEQVASGSYTVNANTPVEPCIVVPLKTPASGYYTKFVWVGDLNGDGEFEYVIDRLAPFDASNNDIGLGHQYLEAYTSTGTRMWVIDMGPSSTELYNISPGAATISMGMYDGVTVYDMDRSGKAEVILKIANGVKFNNGTVFSNSDANKQFIAIVDGQTGNLITSKAFPTDFYSKAGKYGTQLGIAYDGSKPIVVGWLRNRNSDKSFNDIMVGWYWNGGSIGEAWKYLIPSTATGFAGDHQMVISDVNGDGKDEICPGNYVLNSDGTLRYKLPGIPHGDRHYICKMDPKRSGLQGYGICQDAADFMQDYYFDANTGAILWEHFGTAVADMGRGLVGEIDPNYSGWEAWTFNAMWNAPTGKNISATYPYPCHSIWWDGDLLTEGLNDSKLEKWDYAGKTVGRLETLYKYEGATIAGHNPMFMGDIFGDWRTEIVTCSPDFSKLVIFTTNVPTSTRIYTMAHNPSYRNAMTIKGYYESPLLDYYLGAGMATPPKPNISYVAVKSAVDTEQPLELSFQENNKLILSPNPVNGNSVVLRFNLINRSQAQILIFDNLGKAVYQKKLGIQEAGEVTQTIDVTSLVKGIYIVKLQINDGSKTAKLIRL